MRTTAALAALLLGPLVLTGCADDPERVPTAASRTSSPSPTGSASGTPTPDAAALSAPAADAGAGRTGQQVRLTGDGVALPGLLLEFGAPVEKAEPALRDALGTPTLDTGVVASASPYGACPGTSLRALEYGDGALVLLFGDVGGTGLTMYGWTLQAQGSPEAVPRASALVGDVTTLEFGVGTALVELQSGAPGQVQTAEGDELLPPSFRFADQSSGFYGQLTGTGPDDTVTLVLGGEGCGE